VREWEWLERQGAKTIVVACTALVTLSLLFTAVICYWQTEQTRALGVEAFKVECGYAPGGFIPWNLSTDRVTSPQPFSNQTLRKPSPFPG